MLATRQHFRLHLCRKYRKTASYSSQSDRHDIRTRGLDVNFLAVNMNEVEKLILEKLISRRCDNNKGIAENKHSTEVVFRRL